MPVKLFLPILASPNRTLMPSFTTRLLIVKIAKFVEFEFACVLAGVTISPFFSILRTSHGNRLTRSSA
jgi:hypothetical protein